MLQASQPACLFVPRGSYSKMVSACHSYKIRNETRALLLRLTDKTGVLGNEQSVKCMDGTVDTGTPFINSA
jgi:hypothetical protein